MLDCMIFSGKDKKVEAEISDFLKTFPPDYDINNIKISSSGAGGGWTHLVIIFKVAQ